MKLTHLELNCQRCHKLVSVWLPEDTDAATAQLIERMLVCDDCLTGQPEPPKHEQPEARLPYKDE
jgi:hypothetical protein